MTKTAVIQFHRDTAECWRAKGRPLFAQAHEERAVNLADDLSHPITNKYPLTHAERAGDELGIMGEIARTVRL